jgi:predicted TIM-barrel fold metal-dependent hydrolase
MIGSAAALSLPLQAARPKGYLVENATHMFSEDQVHFPFHPKGTNKPRPSTVENYSNFVRETKLDHTVIVQSEVYQDDHRYLEYCFEHEPSPGYFKGTCLFDPIDPKTPARIDELVRRLKGRIVGIRIHTLNAPGTPPATDGPMRNRDLQSVGMKNTWRKMHDLGLMVQMQTIPHHAPRIGALAGQFRDMPVIIDHLALPARGTAAEYEDVINLSKLPRVYMKVSSLTDKDKPLVRRLYDAYGPDRLIWGGYGSSVPAFERAIALSEFVFDYATEEERMKIRGLNAMKLYRFPTSL